MNRLFEERNGLYEKQNELKGQREKLERSFAREKGYRSKRQESMTSLLLSDILLHGAGTM